MSEAKKNNEIKQESASLNPIPAEEPQLIIRFSAGIGL